MRPNSRRPNFLRKCQHLSTNVNKWDLPVGKGLPQVHKKDILLSNISEDGADKMGEIKGSEPDESGRFEPARSRAGVLGPSRTDTAEMRHPGFSRCCFRPEASVFAKKEACRRKKRDEVRQNETMGKKMETHRIELYGVNVRQGDTPVSFPAREANAGASAPSAGL